METLPSRVPAAGKVSYFDTDLKGFVLEHRASGGATYYFRYRDATGRIRLNRISRADEMSTSDARAKAYQMKKMLVEGGDPCTESQRFRDVPLLHEFVAERYLPYAKVHKRSWSTDETVWRNHLLPAFGALRMNRVRRSDVVAFHQKMFGRGYAPATCNRALILMKFIYNCAIRWEVLPADKNPCHGVQLLDDHGARERYLSQEEMQRLMAELDTNRNLQACRLIRLLIYTGARKREILNARWEDIDWRRHLLTVPASRSKSKKAHHIPLSEAATELLLTLPRDKDIPWVFYNPKTQKPPVTFFHAWDSIRKKVGLHDVRLHDLRHSFASFLVNAGRSLYEVQRLLGHHDPKVTMRYAHLAPSAMLEAVNLVGTVVGYKPALEDSEVNA